VASWFGARLRGAIVVGASFVFAAALGCSSSNSPLFGNSVGNGGEGGAPVDGSITGTAGSTPDSSAALDGSGGEDGTPRDGSEGAAADESSNTGGSTGDVGPDVASEAESGPTCGNESQDCCPGGHCTAPLTLCSNGKCTACGAWGGACCPDFGCRDAGCCSNGVCVANGGNCEMVPSANLCTNGACRDCGAPGSTCCGAQVRTCQQGLACAPAQVGDRCIACGAIGQSCCGLAGSPFCNGDLVCSGGQCKQCGIVNGPCCPTGPACGPSMVCDPNKTCQPCGSTTQLCCQQLGQPVCFFGFTCTADGRCTPCGNSNQICCANRTCVGGACVRGGNIESCHTDCGAAGQLCCSVADCPNGQCDGCLFGLDCDLTTGRCIGP